MTTRAGIAALMMAVAAGMPCPAGAQVFDQSASDSLPADTLIADTSAAAGLADTSGLVSDSVLPAADSLATVDTAAVEAPVPPPVALIDSLVYYFARHIYPFDLQEDDLYPRNAAGFVYQEASFFAMSAMETPLRTTAAPFGLPGGQITVRSRAAEYAPFDRTTPTDGLIDFDDIATGDVARAGIVEGPLAGFNSVRAGSALLYLEPFEIPEGPARSRLIVERGAFGYAYTRGRIARMFSRKVGFAFSTDYRKGEGYRFNTDDDSYNVRARGRYIYRRRNQVDVSLGVYRRKGGFSTYRRLRRDQQLTVTVTRQGVFGGQIQGRYNLDLSRSADPYKTIRPRNTFAEMVLTMPRRRVLLQVTARLGKEQYYLNLLYKRRFYGFGEIAGLAEAMGGRVFFFGRAGDAENEEIALEGAAGYAARWRERWNFILSGGRLHRRPDLADLYLMKRTSGAGLVERGNPDLGSETRTFGNAMLAGNGGKAEASVSVTAGRAEKIVYYDRRSSTPGQLEIIPDTDKLTFGEVNVGGSFHDLWLFFGRVSASARRIESERFGGRPPYSPRWQIYGQLGLKYLVARYKVRIRLFGDVTYTERPLSFLLQELETTAVISGGINASLKDFTFYYMIHNMLNQFHLQPEDYGYTGWFYSWGFHWKFLD